MWNKTLLLKRVLVNVAVFMQPIIRSATGCALCVNAVAGVASYKKHQCLLYFVITFHAIIMGLR